MRTLLSIFLILVAWGIADFVLPILMNIAGLPGTLAAGTKGKRTKHQYWFGVLLTFLGQAYVYYGYMAFVVNWTHLAAARPDVIGWLLWPFAFLATIFLIMKHRIIARTEAREERVTGNPQVEAIVFTELFSVIAFFVFAIFPVTARYLYWYMPYMR